MQYLAQENGTLGEILQKLMPGISRRKLNNLFSSERVLVNSQICLDPEKIIGKEEKITVRPKVLHLPHNVKVIFEDLDFLVIEKPNHLLSVATEKEHELSVHGILKKWKRKMIYPVHRLDRETSGVMVFAQTKRAQDFFKALFQKHDIRREYYAIVEGKIDKDSFWESYLYEDANFYMHSSNNSKKGKFAKTHYSILKSGAQYTSLQVNLETGRKNQIRVQAAASGHPIIGDSKYGAAVNPLKRLGLHAAVLGFQHPLSKKEFLFFSPPSVEFNSFFRYHRKKGNR
ncbi:MAG: RluA family pseudouridine synthase [Simkaniaceae bacterium]